MRTKLKLLILLLLLQFPNLAKSQSILDQFDTTYIGGLSARTLPGYSIYQTFTAGLTGVLTQIDMGFFNFISGNGTLEVYEDTGIAFNLLFSSTFSVNCLAGSCFVPFMVNCNVVAGHRYTYHFIPGSGIPDPYGVQNDYLNGYSGGGAYIIDPSGTYPLNIDFVYKTYVDQIKTSVIENGEHQTSLYTIRGNEMYIPSDLIANLYSISGGEIKIDNPLRDGLYILKIAKANTIYTFRILIIN